MTTESALIGAVADIDVSADGTVYILDYQVGQIHSCVFRRLRLCSDEPTTSHRSAYAAVETYTSRLLCRIDQLSSTPTLQAGGRRFDPAWLHWIIEVQRVPHCTSLHMRLEGWGASGEVHL